MIDALLDLVFFTTAGLVLGGFTAFLILCVVAWLVLLRLTDPDDREKQLMRNALEEAENIRRAHEQQHLKDQAEIERLMSVLRTYEAA